MAEAKKTTKKTKKPEKAEAAPKAVKEQAVVEQTAESTPVEVTEEKVEEKAPTKAGKRSPKALKEAEELEAKEARKAGKAEAEAAEEPKKSTKKPTRTKLERAGKKFRKAAELVEKDKEYTLKEALDLAIKTSPVKFDATVELHIRLGVDPRQADQNIRDNLVLPAGTGRVVRVAVFAEADDAAAAKKAGADIAGSDDLLKQIDKGKIDFDILISTPSQMAKLGKYARVLGPKGLMPNPKSGTVTTDVVKAIQQSKAGRVEYRVDPTGIVHLGMGKVSFGVDKLDENAHAVLASVKAAKPSSIKGNYVKGIHVSTSMGPSIRVAISEF